MCFAGGTLILCLIIMIPQLPINHPGKRTHDSIVLVLISKQRLIAFLRFRVALHRSFAECLREDALREDDRICCSCGIHQLLIFQQLVMQGTEDDPVRLRECTLVLFVDSVKDLVKGAFLLLACAALLLGRDILAIQIFKRDLALKGLLQLVVFQFQLAFKVNRVVLLDRQQMQQIPQEVKLLVHICIEHPDNLRDIAIPFNEIPDKSAELITLLRILGIISVGNGLQCARHSAHRNRILNAMLIPHSNKVVNVHVRVDRIVQQLSFGLVDEVNIDLLLQKCLLIERLEGIEDVLLRVCKIKDKRIHFACTGAVQA